MTDEEFVEALISAPDAQARHALIDEHADFARMETVRALKDRADRFERADPQQTVKLGEFALEIAECLDDDEARAIAYWAQANGHTHLFEPEPAVRCYQRAAELFEAVDKPLEAARANIGQMGMLIRMGQLDHVQELAKLARPVFLKYGDIHYQAITDMNLGNLYYWRGDYTQALNAFRSATEAFQSLNDPLHVAMNQINQANMLNELDEFEDARQLHEQARPVFVAAGLTSAVAAVDHDLAILYSASGNYSEAFRTYERARDSFTTLSDQSNLAQVDLEESDLYLHLNLPEEAFRLAERAETAFSTTGMIFDLARARSNRAVALARQGKRADATAALDQVRGMFLEQGNEAWAAQTDVQRAEVIGQIGQRDQAKELAASAAHAYEKLGMKTHQAYAHIVNANLWVDDHETLQARQELDSARSALGDLRAPWLEQRIDTSLGRIAEMAGARTEAIEYYRSAAGRIEQLTAGLAAEEHRTAFVADKLAPYEALVTLYAADDPKSAFQWAERAKSRALVDLLAAGVRPRLRIEDEMDAQRVKRLQALRDELNWLYSRLTSGPARGEAGAPNGGAETWAKIQEREREVTSLWRDLQGRHSEQLSFIRGAAISAAELQSRLPVGTAIIEYFIARGQVMAFVVTQNEVKNYPDLVALPELQSMLEKLAFQFSKFQYGPDYYERHKATLLGGTQEVLAKLGEKLLDPFWHELAGLDALIIVPHGPLHALPFQALRMSQRYLIEWFALSYAPSAAVLKFCWEKPSLGGSDHEPLLVGVPDERMTHVQEEIQSLASLLGGGTILLGEQATFQKFQQSVSACGILHLAAHGLFRPDAPLLSSIHLADRWLAVQDIYDLDLQASLVTLSACETGLGHDAGGDDLMGLVRGFLYAGAASLIVSLWTVDDEAMTNLTVDFYTHWLAGEPKARALRQAQLDLLEKYEHPFYWAPLVLVGNEN